MKGLAIEVYDFCLTRCSKITEISDPEPDSDVEEEQEDEETPTPAPARRRGKRSYADIERHGNNAYGSK